MVTAAQQKDDSLKHKKAENCKNTHVLNYTSTLLKVKPNSIDYLPHICLIISVIYCIINCAFEVFLFNAKYYIRTLDYQLSQHSFPQYKGVFRSCTVSIFK